MKKYLSYFGLNFTQSLEIILIKISFTNSKKSSVGHESVIQPTQTVKQNTKSVKQDTNVRFDGLYTESSRN